MYKIVTGILEFIKTVAVVFIIAYLIKTFLVQTFIVEGSSMEPSFHDGEYLLVDKITYRITEPKRGDVVIFIPRKDDPNKNYIKRVIGLPMEKIKINDSGIFINDKQLSEVYINNEHPMLSEGSEINVALKLDEYFVLGDNRPNSRDSRVIGPIKNRDIVGRTFLVLSPIRYFGFVRLPGYSLPALAK